MIRRRGSSNGVQESFFSVILLRDRQVYLTVVLVWGTKKQAEEKPFIIHLLQMHDLKNSSLRTARSLLIPCRCCSAPAFFLSGKALILRTTYSPYNNPPILPNPFSPRPNPHNQLRIPSQLPRTSVRSPWPLRVIRQSRSLGRSHSRSDARRDGRSAGADLAFDSHDCA